MPSGTNSESQIISDLVLRRDLSGMSEEMKVQYYNGLCKKLNLNPLTNPFEIITFKDGKQKMYATKDCTEQLRKINGISVVELTQEIVNNLCITKCKVQDKEGKFDIATGVTVINPNSTNEFANAIMRSETKAKRRATLSISGLGFMDESETDTIGQYTTTPVSNILVNNTVEIPFLEISKKIDEANTVEELYKIYYDYPVIKGNEDFIKVFKRKKEKLQTPQSLDEAELTDEEFLINKFNKIK